jgi:deoxyribonuclease V
MGNNIYKRAIQTQRDLYERLDLTPFPSDVPLRYVGGTDVSYSRTGKFATAYAGIVVLEFGTWKELDHVFAVREISFPYIPGLLSFRELPVLLDAYEKMTLLPDLWLVDGAGIAHPRRMGLATHLGIILDQPTIGVAKSRLTGTHEGVGREKGSITGLYDRDELVGSVVRTRTNVRPLYISPGNRVLIEQAPELVLSCCTKYRLPEPTRAAHNLVTEIRKEHSMEKEDY